jgi:hypothetical protein
MGGAIMGDRIEGPGQRLDPKPNQCSTQNVYENRLVGYNVVYEYAGKQYSVQLPQDPGNTISCKSRQQGKAFLGSDSAWRHLVTARCPPQSRKWSMSQRRFIVSYPPVSATSI